MKHFKLNLPKHDFPHVHASGHVSGVELKEFVKEIKPKHLFPVHTEHPEMFRGMANQVHENIMREKYEI
jgi:ribonuclease J